MISPQSSVLSCLIYDVLLMQPSISCEIWFWVQALYVGAAVFVLLIVLTDMYYMYIDFLQGRTSHIYDNR